MPAAPRQWNRCFTRTSRWSRLTDLAGTVAHPGVRAEYLADFRRRFDARFAPQRRSVVPRIVGGPRPRGEWKEPTAPATADAKAIRQTGIDPILAKAVVAGLIRHPAEIARHMEVLGSLKLADPALARLFEAVVDVAVADHGVDGPTLRATLARSGFDAIAGDLLRADALAFSFTQAGGDPIRAGADLDEAIATLIAQPEVNEALADATLAMQRGGTEQDFSRQVALVHEKQALELRLANLCQANEDARGPGCEDD